MSVLDSQYIFEKALTARIYNICNRTSVDYMKLLSNKFDNNIWIKREDKQTTFSFKVRGAVNRLSKCSKKELENGTITASAGNHAQGVALASLKKGIPSYIYMPKHTPKIKVDAVRLLGAKVVLTGNNLSETNAAARKYAKKNNIFFLEGYNDPLVIAGQGTIALEIVQDISEIPHIIFVPIGGGGLISGISLVIKKLYPHIKIVGVEPIDSNSMTQSIQKNKIINLDFVNSFAEGVAVSKVGKLNFDCCKLYVDEYVNVTSDEICTAIKYIHDDIRAIAEPAGAVSLAGAISYIKNKKIKKKNLVTINSGSNIDFDRFRYISERVKIGAGTEILLAVKLEEKPGTLKQLCLSILENLQITEFNYRYHHHKNALVFIGIETKGNKDKDTVYSRLKKNKYQFHDLTNNELLKNNIKHMIGGRIIAKQKERLFQFHFPENQNVLINFLNNLVDNWNISLFNYRSYGIDYGKILIGIQTNEDQNKELDNFLNTLDYRFSEETDNISYKLFLAN